MNELAGPGGAGAEDGRHRRVDRNEVELAVFERTAVLEEDEGDGAPETTGAMVHDERGGGRIGDRVGVGDRIGPVRAARDGGEFETVAPEAYEASGELRGRRGQGGQRQKQGGEGKQETAGDGHARFVVIIKTS